ncbi:hypothetical protein SAZ11_09230 [Streptomyces sp. FXJ1.4098]|nr:hypothetical protein [Streptomyces sp. FXJ1.4098]
MAGRLSPAYVTGQAHPTGAARGAIRADAAFGGTSDDVGGGATGSGSTDLGVRATGSGRVRIAARRGGGSRGLGVAAEGGVSPGDRFVSWRRR